jgi:glycosyltransferase involved in cell wall biosynthesis
MMMRLALLGTRGIPNHYGGFERFAEDLASHLPPRGFEVWVACESSYRQYDYRGRARRVFFPVFEPIRWVSEVLYDIVSLLWATCMRFDAIVLFGYSAALGCILPRLLGRKVFIAVDGLEWSRAKFPAFVRRLLKLDELIAVRAATCVICDSRTIQKHILTEYGRRKTTTAFIPYPAKGGRRREDSENGSAGDYYLIVARPEPENNITTMIDGFVLSGSRRRLLVVTTPLRRNSPYCREILARRSSNVMIIPGVYDQTELQSLRAGCFAYIHGQSAGGTSPSLLEALASGNACLVFDTPSAREVAGGAALYYSDAASLSDMIRRLESEEGLREKLIGSIDLWSYSYENVISNFAFLVEAF